MELPWTVTQVSTEKGDAKAMIPAPSFKYAFTPGNLAKLLTMATPFIGTATHVRKPVLESAKEPLVKE